MENKKTYKQIKTESFNIEKAINRISWRFKNENVKIGESKILINELDVKAVEFLIEWINNQKKETLKENELFAKIYAYTFNNELSFYRNPKFANNKIQNVLKKDVQELYDEVHNNINNIELTNYIEGLGINTKHPLLRTDEENENDLRLFKMNNKEITIKIFGTWTIQNVYKSLNNSISELINKYK